MSETKVPCQKCKKEVSFNALKKDEGQWICEACFDRTHYFPDAKMTSMPHIHEKNPPHKPKVPLAGSRIEEDVPSDLHQYQCGGCSYKFERAQFDTAKMCPYCGVKGKVRHT